MSDDKMAKQMFVAKFCDLLDVEISCDGCAVTLPGRRWVMTSQCTSRMTSRDEVTVCATHDDVTWRHYTARYSARDVT